MDVNEGMEASPSVCCGLNEHVGIAQVEKANEGYCSRNPTPPASSVLGPVCRPARGTPPGGESPLPPCTLEMGSWGATYTDSQRTTPRPVELMKPQGDASRVLQMWRRAAGGDRGHKEGHA